MSAGAMRLWNRAWMSAAAGVTRTATRNVRKSPVVAQFLDEQEQASADSRITLARIQSPLSGRHFCDCLKYFKSGGAWFFFAGIRLPSAPT